ncbi:MAG TPA: class I SAM-dependent DNA methyltransferase, partial [Acidobacteriota bacterium]|nr:class I SAM-dependent DNA methyltransferase [Acidobacteriota bacterium]
MIGDPVLFAAGGDDHAFHIIYCRLKSDRLLFGDEREIVDTLSADHPYVLFVFSNQSQSAWHFLNLKYTTKTGIRRVFRRITVQKGEGLRTATERLALLDLEAIQPLSPLAIQQRHDEAFDVEAVTKKFFTTYRDVFQKVEQSIEGTSSIEQRRLFTQRLFNRLMFIAFIQKKGWLRFSHAQTGKGRRQIPASDETPNYLDQLSENYRNDPIVERNFYRERLKLLFFSGLNTPNEANLVSIANGGFLRKLIGDVPYLNGGLFEEDDDDRNPSIFVPDASIQLILEDLFAGFNFTVTESTPLDIEVAVDPEMLGKVFEELVTGRHESGSYYTPKPIVSFMCREALKGYLATELPKESPAALEAFVDQHHPADLTDPEAVLEALRRVTVCDPACGSGAYLLGMLHELLDLRAALFAVKQVDNRSNYDRKLE